ncbi:hypothetical protein [Flagellimonas sp. SN16]|uniref:hypothetical protein n=1 Tax=Flagellimonas sp. SN16 TaxID=3415142 RepID=UPI003C39791B
MSKLISLSIDVNKITKGKLYKGKKGTYLKLTVALNDSADDFGNNVSCWEEQSADERGQQKNYLGNGKVFWESEATQQTQTHEAELMEEDDNLPF